MVSNQVLQSTIDGVKDITGSEFCVMDTEGNILATTFDEGEKYSDFIEEFAKSEADSQSISDCQMVKVYDEGRLEYIVITVGTDEKKTMECKMTALQIESLMVAYRERYDKDNFVKNLLLDNLLLVDIYNHAKKLRIDVNAKRLVFLIETKNEKDLSALETVRGLFTGRTGDFITQVDEKYIILVKEVKARETYRDMEKVARVIVDMLNTEAMTSVRVAYGTMVSELKDVSRSYKESKMALDVGKIFYSDRTVIAYSSLGIGRLIYQLPMPLCRMFIEEIFGENTPDKFDDETIGTINKFFEENLNVSQTSRELFIHRNTLVYRLDKMQKLTGLDIRKFEDAITFKIALMVVEYMKYIDNYEY